LPYTTAKVTSADGEFAVSTLGGPWFNAPQLPYASLAALAAALDQPFEIILDEGLPGERSYPMTLDLGTLASSGLAPPSVSFPTFDQTIGTLNPTFTFTLQTPNGYFADLYHFEGPTGVFDQRDGVPSGATSWNPGVVLQPATQYYLDLYTTIVPIDGAGFSAPLVEGEPIAAWQSTNKAAAETIVRFTTVPEPGGMALLAGGLCALMAYGWRRSGTG